MNSKNDKAPNKYLAPKHMHRLEPFSTHRCATTAASSGDGFGEAASPLPEIHQPDRGRQYCSNVYVEHLLDIGTCVSISTPGQPTEKAFAESFFKTIKCEVGYAHQYQT